MIIIRIRISSPRCKAARSQAPRQASDVNPQKYVRRSRVAGQVPIPRDRDPRTIGYQFLLCGCQAKDGR